MSSEGWGLQLRYWSSGVICHASQPSRRIIEPFNSDFLSLTLENWDRLKGEGLQRLYENKKNKEKNKLEREREKKSREKVGRRELSLQGVG